MHHMESAAAVINCTAIKPNEEDIAGIMANALIDANAVILMPPEQALLNAGFTRSQIKAHVETATKVARCL